MKNKRNSTCANSFLVKIYDILNNGSYQNIIKWVDDGKAFEIVNLPVYMSEILPIYFKHKNFSSFIRQLNMYDFHKVPGESYIFSHPLFVNGNPDQLTLIKRKNSSIKPEKNPNDEILSKIRKLRENNEVLEMTVEKLENMYNEVTSFNQILISHLLKCQDREQHLEEALRLSMNYLKGIQEIKVKNS
jgi:HSF-type DNA-binding